jgi:hypothetical protein
MRHTRWAKLKRNSDEWGRETSCYDERVVPGTGVGASVEPNPLT